MLARALAKLTREVNEFKATTLARIAATPPTGCVMAYSGAAAPAGWLLMDGSAVSRDTYARLFSIFGTTYGAGDGATTFNLPDARGRALVGYDATQPEFDDIGEVGGEKTHTLSESEMPSHTHTVDIGHNEYGVADWDLDYAGAGGRAFQTSGSRTSAATGDGVPHNNLQPYLVLQYIIKT